MRRWSMRQKPWTPPSNLRLRLLAPLKITYDEVTKTYHVGYDVIPLLRCDRCGEWMTIYRWDGHQEFERHFGG